MNSVILVGKLTSNVALEDRGNYRYARLFLSVSRQFKNADGQIMHDIYTISCWEGAAEMAESLFKKGDIVMVRGHLNLSTYITEDKRKQYVDIVGDKITLIPTDTNNHKVEYESEETSSD